MRERENCKGINAVTVVKDDRTVGHVLKNLAAHFLFFLAQDFNKVAGVRVNHGSEYGLEIPCVFKLYGSKQFVEHLERLIDLPNNISVRRRQLQYNNSKSCFSIFVYTLI